MALDDDEVLGVVRFGARREIEAAGDDRSAVDQHDLVVGDGVMGVDDRRQFLLEEEGQFGVRHFFVAVIEDDVNVHCSRLGVRQGLSDGVGGESIGEHENFAAWPSRFP